jgi:hypothetical protein
MDKEEVMIVNNTILNCLDHAEINLILLELVKYFSILDPHIQ